MAEQLKGTKKGSPLPPSKPMLKNVRMEACAKQTHADLEVYRPDWATQGSAAKDKGDGQKTSGGNAVGPQFSAKRS